MQLLMFVSKSNEYLWKETSLTREEKVKMGKLFTLATFVLYMCRMYVGWRRLSRIHTFQYISADILE